MNRMLTPIAIGSAVIMILGALFVTRQRDDRNNSAVDLGNRHEVVGSQKTYESKSDDQGAVTVEVRPIDLSPNSQVWKFEVTLNTHSVELDDDLVAQSVLVDDLGKVYRPLSWEGDPPGGHHREGVLTFQPITPLPFRLELHIRNVGTINNRIFTWQM